MAAVHASMAQAGQVGPGRKCAGTAVPFGLSVCHRPIRLSATRPRRTRTRAHSRADASHAHTHKHTHLRRPPRAHIHTRTRTHRPHSHSPVTHSSAHPHAHPSTSTHTDTHPHMHTLTPTRTPTRAHTRLISSRLRLRSECTKPRRRVAGSRTSPRRGEAAAAAEAPAEGTGSRRLTSPDRAFFLAGKREPTVNRESIPFSVSQVLACEASQARIPKILRGSLRRPPRG